MSDKKAVAVANKLRMLKFLFNKTIVFDVLDHGLLLNMLRKDYYINGSALLWFKSCLNERSFKAAINSSHSLSQNTGMHYRYGVPQGSILGLVYFIH